MQARGASELAGLGREEPGMATRAGLDLISAERGVRAAQPRWPSHLDQKLTPR